MKWKHKETVTEGNDDISFVAPKNDIFYHLSQQKSWALNKKWVSGAKPLGWKRGNCLLGWAISQTEDKKDLDKSVT